MKQLMTEEMKIRSTQSVQMADLGKIGGLKSEYKVRDVALSQIELITNV